MNKEKTNWLSRRLKELGKTKKELAESINVNPVRLTDYENGIWRFQVDHIKPVADFLNFDRMALLDFISGDITEEQLWNTKPDIITESDRALLQAFKTMATAQASNNQNQNIPEQTKNER
jgi:transcriptional regulator with XRE-family HTH domain